MMERTIWQTATLSCPFNYLVELINTPKAIGVISPKLESVIDLCRPLIDAGIALHWLRPFDKVPREDAWSTAPRHTVESLRAAYQPQANIGIRLGEVSLTPAGYLHLIDLDIRDAAQADDAWDMLRSLLPDAADFPTVISGSGGESRHIYFFTEKPFKSRKLAVSDGFSMVFDPKKGREVKKNDWEIELFGTGKQAVLPPSIHPDTLNPYIWEQELDLTMLDLGLGPTVAPDLVASWGVQSAETDDLEDDDDLFLIVRTSPMGLDETEIAKTVADLPQDWVEDRDQWVTVGAALHHEYEGSPKGFDRWCEWSKESSKFDMKTQKSVWKSFRGAKNPVRMATLMQAAGRNRLASEHDWMNDLIGEKPSTLPAVIDNTELADLLGDEPVAPAPKKPDSEWRNLLALTEEGQVKSTLPNIRLIVENDPRTRGVARLNEFTQEIVIRDAPGTFKLKRTFPKPIKQLDSPLWQVADSVNGDLWIDSHDFAVRDVFESPKRQGGYDMKISDRDLKAAVNISSQEHRFHPVREYLLSLKWDGNLRADTMFVDYLGCPDTPYHRSASLLTLIGAVARVFEPGHKFDFVPILEGIQGKGKSTFIRLLGHNWANELTGDISDPKEMIEVMQGQWIMEVGELSSMARADISDLKAFVSRTHDKGRLAYEKRAKVFPRQCIFIGSTNDGEYLRDQTGGRRFWPIKCDIEGQIDNTRFAVEVPQIWAEAYAMYRKMRAEIPHGTLPLYIEDEGAEREAEIIQESRRVESAEDVLMGQIQEWLDQPIGTDSGFDDLDADAPKMFRNETCIRQVWVEVMHKDGMVPHREAMTIGKALAALPGWYRTVGPTRFSGYGKVRTYRRGGVLQF